MNLELKVAKEADHIQLSRCAEVQSGHAEDTSPVTLCGSRQYEYFGIQADELYTNLCHLTRQVYKDHQLFVEIGYVRRIMLFIQSD